MPTPIALIYTSASRPGNAALCVIMLEMLPAALQRHHARVLADANRLRFDPTVIQSLIDELEREIIEGLEQL